MHLSVKRKEEDAMQELGYDAADNEGALAALIKKQCILYMQV